MCLPERGVIFAFARARQSGPLEEESTRDGCRAIASSEIRQLSRVNPSSQWFFASHKATLDSQRLSTRREKKSFVVITTRSALVVVDQRSRRFKLI